MVSTRDDHADIFADAHRCWYLHYPTYVGYSAILSDNAEVDADIRIRMAIPSPYPTIPPEAVPGVDGELGSEKVSLPLSAAEDRCKKQRQLKNWKIGDNNNACNFNLQQVFEVAEDANQKYCIFLFCRKTPPPPCKPDLQLTSLLNTRHQTRPDTSECYSFAIYWCWSENI